MGFFIPFCYKYISTILFERFQIEISYVSVAEDNWFSKFKPTTEKKQTKKTKTSPCHINKHEVAIYAAVHGFYVNPVRSISTVDPSVIWLGSLN